MTNQHSLDYGNSTIRYELNRAARKTLEISVHPDLSVTVTAPEDSEMDRIEAKVKKRARWIIKQQQQFERYLPHLPPRQYVSGETHRYLGRQYRLKVTESMPERVKLSPGFLYIDTRDKANTGKVCQLLDEWYRRQARRVFAQQLARCFNRVEHLGVPYPEISIRVMKTRWGSCDGIGKITLNIKLIQVPKRYIDYVIIHELCHLKEHNHSKHFYQLLDRTMPDWKSRKSELNNFDFS